MFGLAVFGQERRHDHEEGLLTHRPDGREGDDQGQGLGQQEPGEGDETQHDPGGDDRPSTEPIGRCADRERRDGGRHGRVGRYHADRRRRQPERGEIQVEVDPVEAQRGAGYQRREEEQPSIPVEAGNGTNRRPARPRAHRPSSHASEYATRTMTFWSAMTGP
jgi:hypothetical protein